MLEARYTSTAMVSFYPYRTFMTCWIISVVRALRNNKGGGDCYITTEQGNSGKDVIAYLGFWVSICRPYGDLSIWRLTRRPLSPGEYGVSQQDLTLTVGFLTLLHLSWICDDDDKFAFGGAILVWRPVEFRLRRNSEPRRCWVADWLDRERGS